MKQEIFLLVPEMSYTGTPESVLNMSIGIKRLGFYVTVGTFSDGPKREEFISNGVYVVNIDDSFFESKDFKDIVGKYAMCIVNTSMLAKYANFIQRYIPTVLLIREAKSIYEFGKIFQVDMKNIYQVKEVYCVSEYARDCIKDICGITSKVIYNYVPDRYRKSGYARIACQRDVVNYAIIGTVEERKGVHIAVEAFKQLEFQIKNRCILHIVGRVLPWQEEYWKPLLEKIGSLDNIFYYGEIKERESLLNFYSKMDVIIVASRDESCSLVALEGAMMAKALVVTNNTGARYLIKNGNGYICKTGDSKYLSLIVKKIYKNRRKLKKMGKISRKQYLKTASEKVYYKQLNILITKHMTR